ncbi:MAG: hypothetical protein ACLQCB_14620 [Spirochaetia bacterium]
MGTSLSVRSRVLDEAILRLRRFTSIQLRGMAQVVSDHARHACLHAIASCAAARIDALSEMVRAGATSPLRPFRVAEAHPCVAGQDGALRIGVYALAANPLHWGHLLVGLSALVLMRLDRVVFVIAGTDPRKPFLLAPEIRHPLARTVIEAFHPFFAYSPIALGTDLDGETNLGRLFALNPSLSVHAFYIAGSDHCRRRNEEGRPDTIEKLEEVTRALRPGGNRTHSVSAVFVDRPGERSAPDRIDTFLDVHVLPAMPLVCSSTAARQALCAGELTEALTLVPYSTFAEIRYRGLYDGGRACHEISA